jgi:DNA polymerase-3 subunit epsilon
VIKKAPRGREPGAAGEGEVFTAFDLETTGLDPRKDEIAEIGAVKFDRRGIIGRFSTLVNPGVPMPPGAGRVNGITDEMLAGKPPLDEALPEFLRFIGESVLVAHNAPFDCGFINEGLRRRFDRGEAPFPKLPNPVVDTLASARRCFPGRRAYNLGSLAAFLGIRSGEAHRAEDDARVCMEIFLRCFGQGIEEETEEGTKD